MEKIDNSPCYLCLSCDKAFREGFNFSGDKFCFDCVKSNQHIEYYRDKGLDDLDIYHSRLTRKEFINK